MLKTVSTQLALASDTLSEILAKDNTSGPYNIAMDSGYGIGQSDDLTNVNFPGSNVIVASTSGEERLRISSTGASTFLGTVGVNDLNPTAISSGASTLSIKGTVPTKGGNLRLNSSDESVAAYLYADNASGLSINTSTSHSIVFRTVGIEAARFNTSGNLAFGNGKGIDFSATAGTGTSELLDDYEEGTFTAVLGGSGGTSGQTYTFRQAKYTKVGNLVTCVVLVQVAAKGTITGNLQIQGLPFTSASYATISAPYLFGFTGVTGAFITGSLNSGGTAFTLYSIPVDGSSPTILTTTALSAAPQISFTISYIV